MNDDGRLNDDISCILEKIPTAYDVDKVIKELNANFDITNWGKPYGITLERLQESSSLAVLWMNRKYTIYAVDFDGTLCESIFPGIGNPNMALINHLIKRRKQGNKIILWTCRVGDRLNEAVEWCGQFGLEFDAVNENLPEMVEYWGCDSRKIFADVYIDDKAVNKPKYRIPYKAFKI